VEADASPMKIHRRSLLQFAPFAFAQTAASEEVPATYPSHPPQLAREMVGASHGNLARVKELVKAQPTLSLASWDWGFGDWETALGAASHVGNRPIAELLIENGAPPTLFSATMLGQMEVVKALIESHPGAQRIPGPHSISLLDHARAGGPPSKPVFDFLEKLGDAGAPPSQPLTDEAKASIKGTYTFGPGPNDRIEITVEDQRRVQTRRRRSAATFPPREPQLSSGWRKSSPHPVRRQRRINNRRPHTGSDGSS
jgi:hypothetical protein